MPDKQIIRQIANKVNIVANFAQQRNVNGTNYAIYPCVLLVEGVHHGVGTTPVYYSQNILQESANNWNNVPVTIGHPVVNGEHVMCNDDGTIRQQFQVGHVVNSRFEDGKLKADLWINKDEVEQKSPGLLSFLENGGDLDVSTGLLAGEDEMPGTWNSEEFTASILEIIPDHLALLPGSTGACSFDDGCGVRFNQGVKKQPELLVLESNLLDISEKVHRYIDSLDVYNDSLHEYDKINFVRAIYDSYFIYEQKTRLNGTETRTLLKQNYNLNENEEIVIEEAPVEVVENITYTERSNSHNNSNGGKEMAEKGCCPKKVQGLIANENNGFVEEDKDWLSALNEDQLEKLVVNFDVEPAAVVEPVVEPVVAPVQNSVAEQIADFLKDAPAPVVSFINEGMRTLDEKRSTLITSIVNHEGSKFTEKMLAGMETNMIEGIANMIPAPVVEEPSQSFGLSFPAPIQNSAEEVEPYTPTTLSGVLGKKE